MQKYDAQFVDEMIHFINESSRAVSTILRKDGALEDSEIDKLTRLYSIRREKIAMFDKWYHSDIGKEYIKANPKNWEMKIQRIIKTDGEIIKNFEKRVKDLGDTIRKLVKRKSILIYSKE